MKDVAIYVACCVAGLVLLRLFYTAVRIEWPANYITAPDVVGLIVSRSMQRYLSFVLAPIYLVSLLASTVAIREGLNGLMVGIVLGLVHGLRHHGYRLMRAYRSRVREKLWHRAALLNSGLLVLAVVAAAAGGLGPGPFEFVVPPVEEFFKAFWTTAFIAVVAVIVARRFRYPTTVDALSEIAMREVPYDLVHHARTRAEETGTDVRLVLAILFAENLQRPRWFRRLEYLKGKLLPGGSYGIMQVRSEAPISDQESINQAIANHLSGIQIPTNEYRVPDREVLTRVLRGYNSNPAFVELAEGLYYNLPSAERI